jgi:hypothetical protein
VRRHRPKPARLSAGLRERRASRPTAEGAANRRTFWPRLRDEASASWPTSPRCRSPRLASPSTLNAQDLRGDTILHIAALHSELELVRLILSAPGNAVDVTTPNAAGLTAAEVAHEMMLLATAIALRGRRPETTSRGVILPPLTDPSAAVEEEHSAVAAHLLTVDHRHHSPLLIAAEEVQNHRGPFSPSSLLGRSEWVEAVILQGLLAAACRDRRVLVAAALAATLGPDGAGLIAPLLALVLDHLVLPPLPPTRVATAS